MRPLDSSSSVVDLVCRWTRLRHRAGEDFPFLLPEAQDEGHQLLPGRSVRGADWLAHHRGHPGDLRVFPPVQVGRGIRLVTPAETFSVPFWSKSLTAEIQKTRAAELTGK